jgi:hypothetical protein
MSSEFAFPVLTSRHTVVSGQLNVVNNLKRTNRLPLLEEVDMVCF